MTKKLAPFLLSCVLLTTPACIGTGQQSATPSETPQEKAPENNPSAQSEVTTKKEALVTNITTEEELAKLVQKAEKPVAIKLWAQWCGACKVLAPVFESVAQELSPSYQFASVDIDKVKSITKKYAIQGVPAIIFFKNGNFLSDKTHVGSTNAQALKEKITNALK